MIVQLETDPETGDLLLPLAEDLLAQVGWKIGDTLTFTSNADGSITLSRKKDESLHSTTPDLARPLPTS